MFITVKSDLGFSSSLAFTVPLKGQGETRSQRGAKYLPWTCLEIDRLYITRQEDDVFTS